MKEISFDFKECNLCIHEGDIKLFPLRLNFTCDTTSVFHYSSNFKVICPCVNCILKLNCSTQCNDRVEYRLKFNYPLVESIISKRLEYFYRQNKKYNNGELHDSQKSI